MTTVPEQLQYTAEHEWVSIDDLAREMRLRLGSK